MHSNERVEVIEQQQPVVAQRSERTMPPSVLAALGRARNRAAKKRRERYDNHPWAALRSVQRKL